MEFVLNCFQSDLLYEHQEDENDSKTETLHNDGCSVTIVAALAVLVAVAVDNADDDSLG